MYLDIYTTVQKFGTGKIFSSVWKKPLAFNLFNEKYSKISNIENTLKFKMPLFYYNIFLNVI